MDNTMKALHELEELVARIRVAIEEVEEQTFTLKAEIKELLNEFSQEPERILPIEYAVFDNCYLKGTKYKSIRKRVYNVLAKNGYDNMYMLSRKTVPELLMYRNSGICVVAFIIVLCEHYGIELRRGSLSPKVNDELNAHVAEFKKCVSFLQ